MGWSFFSPRPCLLSMQRRAYKRSPLHWSFSPPLVVLLANSRSSRPYSRSLRFYLVSLHCSSRSLCCSSRPLYRCSGRPPRCSSSRFSPSGSLTRLSSSRHCSSRCPRRCSSLSTGCCSSVSPTIQNTIAVADYPKHAYEMFSHAVTLLWAESLISSTQRDIVRTTW